MSNSPQFYLWKDFKCAYTVHTASNSLSQTPPLVLIHPVGVGLSGIFWHRFIKTWLLSHPDCVIYNPDLLGCGASELPSVAYYPVDWANQIENLIKNVVQRPVILIVQGASFPIAIKLLSVESNADLIKGLVLSLRSKSEIGSQKSEVFSYYRVCQDFLFLDVEIGFRDPRYKFYFSGLQKVGEFQSPTNCYD